jgi:hypothetical protein
MKKISLMNKGLAGYFAEMRKNILQKYEISLILPPSPRVTNNQPTNTNMTPPVCLLIRRPLPRRRRAARRLARAAAVAVFYAAALALGAVILATLILLTLAL